jgi:hypothetical protein
VDRPCGEQGGDRDQRGLVLCADRAGRKRRHQRSLRTASICSPRRVIGGRIRQRLARRGHSLRILDPILAALVGLSVLWAGWRVMRDSVGGLLDEPCRKDLARIRAIIAAMRTARSGA